MTYHESDKERIKQAEELSARLNGVKVIYKATNPNRNVKVERNKWNTEAKKQRLKLLNKYK